AKDALSIIGNTRLDMIVLDIFMPGIDGIELCRRIKANPETRDIEVILASVDMTKELEALGKTAGAERAICKPFSLPALVDPPKQIALPVEEPGVMTKTTRGAD